MTVLERLTMELSNQEYLSKEQYVQLLDENGLNSTDSYHKKTMCRELWHTCIDVLETVCNDVDIMTGISTEFSDMGQAYDFMEARIVNLKDKIASIPEEDEEVSPFALIYTGGKGRAPMRNIESSVIDELE